MYHGNLKIQIIIIKIQNNLFKILNMSYLELRNFCETMRALGYHRNISMENFRDPNFELVADILYWFAQRYDPKMDISDDIEDEKDRVNFIRSVC